MTVDNLVLKGSDGSIFAIGDCTSTAYAPTAQVASQQGAYLARKLKQMAKTDSLAAEVRALQMEATVKAGEEDAERKARVEKLEKQLEKASKMRPFHYSHQGSLAYVPFL